STRDAGVIEFLDDRVLDFTSHLCQGFRFNPHVRPTSARAISTNSGRRLSVCSIDFSMYRLPGNPLTDMANTCFPLILKASGARGIFIDLANTTSPSTSNRRTLARFGVIVFPGLLDRIGRFFGP